MVRDPNLGKAMYESTELISRHVIQAVTLQLVVSVLQPGELLFERLVFC